MLIYIAILFFLTYVFIIAFPKRKVYITLTSALIASVSLIISGDMKFIDVLNAIDYNVILMLFGITLTVGIFSASNMPNKIAEKMISKINSSTVAIVFLAVLSGVISAFVDNVATVLMLAPVGIAVSKKVGVSPIPVLISIAVSSNLQGAATLVGDTTSVMLAGSANLSFIDFFFLNGKPSIFWAVELGAVATVPVLYFLFRKGNKELNYTAEEVEVTSNVPFYILLLNLLTLVVFSFIPNKIELTNGIICMAYGIVSLVFYSVKFKLNVKNLVKDSVDFQTILFLIFLYILIKTVDKVGIILKISEFFASIGDTNVFLLYTVIVWGSVFLSMFIDNIPYVATMLPVIKGLCLSFPSVSPYLFFFGLLIGATLGGNLTPVGASANVVAIGVLEKEGYKVKNKDFFKIGIPFTLIAVLMGYGFTWLIWGI